MVKEVRQPCLDIDSGKFAAAYNRVHHGGILCRIVVLAEKVVGYAGTENRDYCEANGIQTSFVKRGRPFGERKKEKDLVRQELARVWATEMEGSCGTQKEHYNLRRVKARTKRTEILYIFFGIHTANVVQLADRIEQRTRLAAA